MVRFCDGDKLLSAHWTTDTRVYLCGFIGDLLLGYVLKNKRCKTKLFGMGRLHLVQSSRDIVALLKALERFLHLNGFESNY